jgi:hypothetical protein
MMKSRLYCSIFVLGLISGGVLALGAGCAASPPIGYSSGVRWTVPLVDPLDGGALLIPASIHGKGPFLFALDPDAQVSLIDRGVAAELGLYTPPSRWVRFVDERDRTVPRRPYEVLRFEAGDLRVENVVMYSAPAGSLRGDGRVVHGVLGRDLLSRTIVIDVDRDRGVVRLALTGHQQPPAEARRVRGWVHKPHDGPVRKLILPVRTEAGTRLALAVDLAARRTAVHERLRERLGAVAALHVDGVVAGDVALEPLADRRVRASDYDGVLGQDVLARYRVVFDPDARTLWLAPRAANPAALVSERLARWGDALACADVGCVRLRPHGSGERGRTVIERSDGAPASWHHVVLQALDQDGRPLPLPLVRVAVREAKAPSTVEELVPAAYRRAAGFRVVDATPF